MSTVRANTYLDATGGSNAVFSGVASPPNSMGFRNRILNGSMVIDQRNAGASVTPVDAYVLDRWEVREDTDGAISVQQVSDAPAGFSFSQRVTTTTADASLTGTQRLLVAQPIEGFNTADLAFGTASAQTVTVSFWVKSSLTGTFSGSLQNAARSRSFVFNYSISSANTWEYKTVTIAGDTTGTWIGATNGVGLRLNFALGIGPDYTGTANSWQGSQLFASSGSVSVIGTLNATWQITGVQLEAGTVASPFERRDFGRELMMCQRYFETNYDLGVAPANGAALGDGYKFGVWTAGVLYEHQIKFQVAKRAQPSITYYRSSLAGTNGQWFYFNGSFWVSASSTTTDQASQTSFAPAMGATGLTSQNTYLVQGGWAASSEL